jgi:hypothetical protein
VKEAWRVVLKRRGCRTRRLIVQGAEPKTGDTIRIDGASYIVSTLERTDIVAAFETHGKRLKQVYP